MSEKPKRLTLKALAERLDNIENRLERLESQYTPTQQEETVVPEAATQDTEKFINFEEDELELQIGENWFAKIGIIVLTMGLVFFLTYPFANLPGWFSPVLGLLATLVLFALSGWTSTRNSIISGYLFGSAWVVAFFMVLRLHFFSNTPLLGRTSVEVLLFLLIAVFLYLAFQRQSGHLTTMGIVMGATLALLLDEPLQTFTLLAALSGWAAFTRVRLDISGILISGQFIVFFGHLLWFMNNPLAGRKIAIVHSPHFHLYFILLYIVIFALGNLFRKNRSREDTRVILSCFLSVFLGFGLFLLGSLTGDKAHLSTTQFVAFATMMILATVFWIREQSKISTFTYAMIAYGALSVAIISRFTPPNYFFWLCWQSLLVIVTALWFRSKIIVLANFFIFLFIFLISAILAGTHSDIAFSFGIVALLSARIMNWQKHRLDLKTEFMRNSYLVTSFLILPYAIYRALPETWEIFGWICLAGFYFILSVVLNNRKYRWMGIGTILLTIGYLFIIGIVRLEGVYRILSFMALGFALVFISLFYSKYRKKRAATLDQSHSK